MKLILAIVHNDDAYTVNAKLSVGGFLATKISSTGGFLMSGNSTFLIGVNDDCVEDCIALIKRYSKKRTQPMPVGMHPDSVIRSATPAAMPSEITVGGATIFVLNVEDFRQV